MKILSSLCHSRLRLVTLALVFGVPLRAADVEILGFDQQRLERIDLMVQREIAAHKLAGAVALVKRDGKDVLFKAYGAMDVEKGIPMRTDTIFRIASMTKAITTVAALMLYEEGYFLLNDPISNWLPELKGSVVAVSPPAGSPRETKYVLTPAKRGITIRDLLTHTAGLTYGDGLAVDDYEKAHLHNWFLVDHDETVGEAVKRLATLPLSAQPGEEFNYGYGTDVLGYLVEVVSGQPLDRFIGERICRPLGMKDTVFFLPEQKRDRLAVVYGLVGGKLKRMEDAAHTDFIDGPRKLFSGGAGMVSTAGDYGCLLQMLLNGGELDGVRLLSPRTVALMRTNHTGNLLKTHTHAFGLGFWVNDEPGILGENIGVGAFGWGSAYNPQYIVDPQERIVALIMLQLQPSNGANLNQRFKTVLYQALK